MFEAGTAIVALLVGTLVTLVAGSSPARRATKCPGRGAARRRRRRAASCGSAGRRARGGVGSSAAAAAGRRLGRPARAPQRDAQPRPHGRHRERADDRRALVTAVTVVANGLREETRARWTTASPPPTCHGAGRLVADGPGGRAQAPLGPRRARRHGAARTAASCSATRRSSTRRPDDRSQVFDFDWVEGTDHAPVQARRRRRRSSTRAGRPSTACGSATRSRSPRPRATSSG